MLCTSRTWMFAIASSVHGTGSVELSSAARRHLCDVGVDIDVGARLQIAGEAVRPRRS